MAGLGKFLLKNNGIEVYNGWIDAGWSSLVARRAHNPKVIGSNPVPATKSPRQTRIKNRGIPIGDSVFLCLQFLRTVVRLPLYYLLASIQIPISVDLLVASESRRHKKVPIRETICRSH